MSNPFDLSGETAAVIGGTGVLGGAMAQALASAGAKVAIVGRDISRGEAKAKEIGSNARFFSADAMDLESLKEARALIAEAFGQATVLVNAAGGNSPAATLSKELRFETLPIEDWSKVFDLNLVGGVLYPCQAFAPAMLESRRGSIINIASLSGMTPLSRVVAYSAAKAAVLNLTQFLAREWAAPGVRVNAISPGFMISAQNRALLVNDDGTYTDRGRDIVNHTPMARYGQPEELAGAVVWLASERASGFVTGQNIVVDGGFSAMTI